MSAEADSLLHQPHAVLDHGAVTLLDYMGGDQRIVDAARISYSRGNTPQKGDAALIDYLWRHQHTSPFEQVVITFYAKMPMFVARQWIRHRTARLNEVSGRYSVLPGEFYLPAALHTQGVANKQGSAEALDEGVSVALREAMEHQQADADAHYRALLDAGVSREEARINLPLSTYTELYWQMDLHNLFRFIKLRLDAHAQAEIRAYAQCLLDIARAVAPIATDSFENHTLYGASFSRQELDLIRGLLGRRTLGAADVHHILPASQRREFYTKLGIPQEDA